MSKLIEVKNICDRCYLALRAFLIKAAAFFSWKARVRKRYIFTKENRIRLRYVSLIVFFMATGVVASVVKTHNQALLDHYSVQLASIEPFAGSDQNVIQDDVLRKSVHRNFNLAAALIGRLPTKPHLNRDIKVQSGDSLGVIMEREGVGASETTAIIKAMKEHFDPRYIKAGQVINLDFARVGENVALKEFKIDLDPIKTLVVARADQGFVADINEKKVKRVVRAKQAVVENSLYGSAAKAGIPDAITAEAIRIFSWNTDFQRDINSDDVLEVMYESFETADGHIAKYGDVLYTRLKTRQKDVPLYRFKMADGRVDYFKPDGISIKRTLMKTPIDGARMSSGYGMRRHPVLGYNKMHKGMDFAAPTGTPIYAAGDGVVERAGRAGSYGKYIRIRHNSKLKTAYAHMSKIKVKNGARVTQGQVIGYVGSTGRSTGPHLHYEVIKNGKQVNPRSLDLPVGLELGGSDKKSFKSKVHRLHQLFIARLEGTRIARRASQKNYN